MTSLSWFFTFVVAFSAWAQSSDFPIPRLKGRFSYQDHFQVPNVRRAETVTNQTAEGLKRIQQLRGEGYTCIHKDPRTLLCSRNWKPDQNPPGLDESVRKAMDPIEVEFEGSDSQPKLVHDGSTTQEWDVSERVRILQTQVSMYRVVRNQSGEIFIAFPVNEDQPLAPLKYQGPDKLGLTMIGQVKDSPTSTVAYTVVAFLESDQP